MASAPRLVFCGTPQFAVPALRCLIQEGLAPELVITQPDRRRDRGQKLTSPPVKKLAENAGIPVYQPEKFNSEETWARLVEGQFDYAVVVAYAAKIGPRALGLVPGGWINLHPSLLPLYRGASPIQFALMDGVDTTGVTTFLLNEEWDAGPICLQKEVAVRPTDTYGDLLEETAQIGSGLMVETIRGLWSGAITPTPQDDIQASFAPLLKPEDSRIHWQEPATKIRNRVRGLAPKPGTYTLWNERRLRLHDVETAPPDDGSQNLVPGTIVSVGETGLVVASGDGVVVLREVQPESKARMTGQAFANGARLKPGDRFD